RRPLVLRRSDEGEAASEHSRTLLPRVDQRAALGLVESEVAEDREPVGVRSHGLHAELVRVRIPRRVRREGGGIDTRGVQLLEGIVFEIGGYLPVPRAGGIACIPEMNLRVDDQHGRLLCWKGSGSPYAPMARASENHPLGKDALKRPLRTGGGRRGSSCAGGSTSG